MRNWPASPPTHRRQRIARRAGRREGRLRGSLELLERRADGVLVDGVPGPHQRLPLARGPQRALRGRIPEVSHACLVASRLAKEQVETGGDAEGSDQEHPRPGNEVDAAFLYRADPTLLAPSAAQQGVV